MTEAQLLANDEEDFLVAELSPRSSSAAAILAPPLPTAPRSAWRAPWASNSAALEKFAQSFDALLRAPPAATVPVSSAPSSSEHAVDNKAAAKTAKKAMQLQMLICREVAQQVVGAAEVLELQRLAREHCRRPCSVLRTVSLESAGTHAGCHSGDSTSALGSVEAEAEHAALATLARASTSSTEAAHATLQAGNDTLVEALTARVMRAAESSLGFGIDSELRAALSRRLPTGDTVLNKAAERTRQLAFHVLRDKANAFVVEAVGRARKRSRSAAAQLLAPSLSHSIESERAGWGLKLLRDPPPPVTMVSPALPSPVGLPPKQVEQDAGALLEDDVQRNESRGDEHRDVADEERKRQQLRLSELSLHVNEWVQAYEEEFDSPPTTHDMPRSVRRMQVEVRRLSRRLAPLTRPPLTSTVRGGTHKPHGQACGDQEARGSSIGSGLGSDEDEDVNGHHHRHERHRHHRRHRHHENEHRHRFHSTNSEAFDRPRQHRHHAGTHARTHHDEAIGGDDAQSQAVHLAGDASSVTQQGSHSRSANHVRMQHGHHEGEVAGRRDRRARSSERSSDRTRTAHRSSASPTPATTKLARRVDHELQPLRPSDARSDAVENCDSREGRILSPSGSSKSKPIMGNTGGEAFELDPVDVQWEERDGQPVACGFTDDEDEDDEDNEDPDMDVVLAKTISNRRKELLGELRV